MNFKHSHEFNNYHLSIIYLMKSQFLKVFGGIKNDNDVLIKHVVFATCMNQK